MLNKIKKSIEDLNEIRKVIEQCKCDQMAYNTGDVLKVKSINIAIDLNKNLEILQNYYNELLEEKELYDITYKEWQNIKINDIEISSIIFEEEKIDYRYEDRDDLIENIRELRREATDNNLMLMEQDIEYLESLGDDFVYSSILTNEYIAFSDDADTFNNICKEILEINKNLKG